MSETQEITLPLGEKLPWIRWLLSHADLVPTLVGLIGELQTAEGLRAKYEALKAIGDLLIDAIGDAPIGVNELVSEGESDALTQSMELKFGNGELLKRVVENLPQIIQIVTVIAGLLK